MIIYTALQSILGNAVTAIHTPSLPPDVVFPCAVYGQIYGGDGQNISGGTGSLYRLRYQIDLYHPTFAGVMALRDLVLNGLHRFSSGGILDTRVDLDIGYVTDEMDTSSPNLYRHIIDISMDVEREHA